MSGSDAVRNGTKKQVGPFYISAPTRIWFEKTKERTGLSFQEIGNIIFNAFRDAEDNDVLGPMIRNMQSVLDSIE